MEKTVKDRLIDFLSNHNNNMREILNSNNDDFDLEDFVDKINLSPTTRHKRNSREYILDKTNLNRLKNLIFNYPQFSDELLRNSTPEIIIKLLNNTAELNTNVLVSTIYAYPHGGGEAFIREIVEIYHLLGFHVYWCSTNQSGNGEPNKNSDRIEFEDFTEIHLERVSDISNEFIVDQKISLIHDVSGSAHLRFLAKENRINLIQGFHFWTGLFEIRDNVRMKDEYKVVISKEQLEYRNSTFYVCSDFMHSKIEKNKKSLFKVAYPIFRNVPNYNNIQRDKLKDKFNLQSITIFNANYLKGGDLLEKIFKRFGERFKYNIVIHENNSKRSIEENLKELNNNSVKIHNYLDTDQMLKMTSVVILPTRVQETFSRIAIESIQKFTPVLHSGKGNLASIFGENQIDIDPEDEESWFLNLEYMLNSFEVYEKMLVKQNKRVRMYLEKGSRNLDDHILWTNVRKRIGLFSVLNKKGLGKYTSQLIDQYKSLGFEVYVFAYKSYFSEDTVDLGYRKVKIGEYLVDCYFSNYTREEVPTIELKRFMVDYDINTLVVPELVYYENFKRIYELNVPNLKVIVIPMIEIVNNYEIDNYKLMSLNCYPTMQSKLIFEKNKVKNGHYIGYNPYFFKDKEMLNRKINTISKSKLIKIVHIGGYNAVNRKNSTKILEVLIEAAARRTDISITMTLPRQIIDNLQSILPNNLNIITETLTDEQISKLYFESDLSIQLPFIEGIGLGFSESLISLTPVITYNSAPNNEFITKETGWFISNYNVKNSENKSSFIEFNDFKAEDLLKLILSIDKKEIASRINNISNKMTSQRQLDYKISLFESIMLESKPMIYNDNMRYSINVDSLGMRKRLRIAINLLKKLMFKNNHDLDHDHQLLLTYIESKLSFIKKMIFKRLR